MKNAQNENATLHLAVWLDHRQARIISLTRQEVHESVIHSPDAGKGHVHHHAGTPGPGHNTLAPSFMENISQAIGEAQNILLLGPGLAKHELKSFLELHRPRQAGRIIGIESQDHGGLSQIVDFARPVFARADRMATQR